ncbi:MAG: extracellular solute-binding protein [Roseburia sp.]|nr:extracellular solute-binding protein [Roseburia sp.]MCM1097512.1 extracellular solute-binding protein [Ruminococcus flavefaciens]
MGGKEKGISLGFLFLLLFSALLAGCGNEEEERPEIVWVLREENEELYNSLKGIEKIEEATGVDITFRLMTYDEYNYMIAFGDYPDVMVSNLYTGEVLDLYDKGITMDLTDLILEKSVYLKEIYERRPDIYKEVQTNDGKLIYFPSINPLEEQEDFYRNSYSGLLIRQDWLDRLGLEIPETIEEWHTVLTAFRDQDPNGNGLADELPFDDVRLWTFAPAFGILDGIFVTPEGRVAYGCMEEGYREYLTVMNQWYREGLISRAAVTGSSKWSEANIIGNLSGSFYGLDNAWRYYLPNLQKKAKNADLTAVPIPRAANGVSYCNVSRLSSHIRDLVTVVTTNCKNPEAALKVIDYMYSEEGTTLLTWGIEGETYKTLPDGSKALLPEALEMNEDSGYLKLHHVAIGHIAFPKYDGETVLLQTYPEEQLTAEMVWADCDTSLLYPANILFSVEDRKKVNSLMLNIDAYASEQKTAFITGEQSMEKYDDFLETLRTMQIEEVIRIYQKNYDIYRKK